MDPDARPSLSAPSCLTFLPDTAPLCRGHWADLILGGDCTGCGMVVREGFLEEVACKQESKGLVGDRSAKGTAGRRVGRVSQAEGKTCWKAWGQCRGERAYGWIVGSGHGCGWSYGPGRP